MAQDPVYPGFLLKNAQDPRWSAAETAYRVARSSRWLAAVPVPELEVSTQGAWASSLPGTDLPGLIKASHWPISGEVSLRLPVVDLQRGARLVALTREETVATARWEAYRQEAFETYLLQLMEVLERSLVRDFKVRISGSYREMAALAQRRQSLGAGSARETLLAEISWKRSLAGAASAGRALSEAQEALGPGALPWVLSLPGETPWFQPQGWDALLVRWGWKESLAEGSEAYRESLAYTLEAESLAWNLAVLGFSEAPQLDFYSTARVEGLPLQSSLEAGLKFTWTPLSDAGWGAGRLITRETLEGRRRELEMQKTRAKAGFAHLQEAYRGQMATVKESIEVRLLAEKYLGTLQSAFSAGTGTLEDVLEAWQLLSGAQEEELSARWSTQRAALRLLRASGSLVLPSEASQ